MNEAVRAEVEPACATVMERFEQIKREKGNNAADAFMVEVLSTSKGMSSPTVWPAMPGRTDLVGWGRELRATASARDLRMRQAVSVPSS